MIARGVLAAALLASAAPAGEAPFLVTAAWEPATPKGPAAVAIRFSPDAPDLRVNRTPPPRLEWPPGIQAVAALPSARLATAPPIVEDPQYLAEGEAYRLFFAARPTAAPRVDARVVFFYCSKDAGWCKKGIAPVSIALP